MIKILAEPVSTSTLAIGRFSDPTSTKQTGRSRGTLPMIDGNSQAIGPGDDPRGSATRDGSHPGGLCTTVLRPRLGQGSNPRHRGDPGHRPAPRLRCAPDHGVEPGTPLHQLPPRPE